MTITPEVRRANRWLLFILILFAVGLAVAVLLWMRMRIRSNGGVVDPTYSLRMAVPSHPPVLI